MKSSNLIGLVVLGAILALAGCKKNDNSPTNPGTPSATVPPVRAICESVSLSVAFGALVGARECLDDFSFNDGEDCAFDPVVEPFNSNCSVSDPQCGVTINTSAAGSLEFLPEFDTATGNLVALRVSGSVSAEFSGNLEGTCGQIGNTVDSRLSIRVDFEVLDEPVTATLSGSLNFGSGGDSRPRFRAAAGDLFELAFPETGMSVNESWEYLPGEHRLELSLAANPQFQGGPSSGGFSLVLRSGS